MIDSGLSLDHTFPLQSQQYSARTSTDYLTEQRRLPDQIARICTRHRRVVWFCVIFASNKLHYVPYGLFNSMSTYNAVLTGTRAWRVAMSENARHVLSEKTPSSRTFVQSKENLYRPHFGWPRVQRFVTRTTKTLIRPRGCAGWLESSLGAHIRKYVFRRCGFYGFHQSNYCSNPNTGSVFDA